MLNQIVLVGRLVDEIQLKENEEGHGNSKFCNITLEIRRAFKNADGEYETDFIPITLTGAVAENTSEYCHKGDIVGVKGRMEVFENNLVIKAEKVTFLSSKTSKEED